LKSNAYLLAWRYAPKVPEPVLRGIANLAADIVWLKQGKGIKRLESNYARVRPELSSREIRKLSRQGMRSYLRYFREAFTLSAVSSAQLAARVRVIGIENIFASLENYGSPVLALGHVGNWDTAGAWVAEHLVPVLTVAEQLKPAEVYQAFVDFRQSLGIEVLGLGAAGVFGSLVAAAKGGEKVIPLLADRDLTHRGIEVDLLGHQARVAVGPATVSLAAGVPLLLTTIHYERLRGTRRKAAGTPWGIVVEFSQPIVRPAGDQAASWSRAGSEVAKSREVEQLTQAWVDKFGEFIKEHTEDWHMLQAVFVADLDADRYAQTLRSAAENEA